MAFAISGARAKRAGAALTSLPAAALLVLLAVVFSRIFYHARGVRLDVSTIQYFDQLLDPELLQTRLAQSLLYLHGQPPLYNLLTALALDLSPDTPQRVLGPIYLACTLYSGLCLLVILVRLRVPALIAAAAASFIVASPAFVLHENWYFYSHLNITWLLGSLAWLAQSRARPGPALAISAAHLAGLVLTRSLFHPLFFLVALLLVLALVARGSRRQALACFALPALLVLLWCGKNQVLFGFFGTSSWSSRNLMHAVSALVGPNRIRAEARRGQLSRATGHEVFESGTVNIKTFRLAPRETGIPVLDDVHKHTGAWHSVSYNHWSYPATAHFYMEDARQLIKSYPRTYLSGLWERALPLFLLPVDDNGFLSANRERIPVLAARFDQLESDRPFVWLLSLGVLSAIAVVLSRDTPRTERVVLALSFWFLVWVLVVGLIGELGENNRFRYDIIWLTWAVALAGWVWALRALVIWGYALHARYRPSITSTSASPAPLPK